MSCIRGPIDKESELGLRVPEGGVRKFVGNGQAYTPINVGPKINF